MSFKMAPNNVELDLKQISYNLFESPDGKIFQDDKDSDLNYFDAISIPSKETTYINETDIKSFLYEKKRFEDVSVFLINIRRLKNNFENFCNLLIKSGSFF